MSYQQTLCKIIEPIKRTTIHRLNKKKYWEYGYNKEHDVIVISKTGKIGDVYEIQNQSLPTKVGTCSNCMHPRREHEQLCFLHAHISYL